MSREPAASVLFSTRFVPCAAAGTRTPGNTGEPHVAPVLPLSDVAKAFEDARASLPFDGGLRRGDATARSALDRPAFDGEGVRGEPVRLVERARS